MEGVYPPDVVPPTGNMVSLTVVYHLIETARPFAHTSASTPGFDSPRRHRRCLRRPA